MSHPPERLLAELARVLSTVDAEAAVHVEFCPACVVRFAAMLRVARTIADLAGGGPLRAAALAEAVQYAHGRAIWTHRSARLHTPPSQGYPWSSQ